MCTRYIGPLIVVLRNYSGAYILLELDGTVLHRPIAAFHLLPYFPCKSLPLPPDIIDINDCKGTSIHSLTSPVSHYVYMYSPRSLYISDHICTTPTS
jgi:hypothetical protein